MTARQKVRDRRENAVYLVRKLCQFLLIRARVPSRTKYMLTFCILITQNEFIGMILTSTFFNAD